MRSPRTQAVLTVLLPLALAALAACGSSRRGIPVVGDKTIDEPVIRQGQIVFAQNCNPCHPGGSGGVGFALNDKPLPQSLIATQVRRGLGEMPSFSEDEISNQELVALAEYLAWLRDLEPKKDALTAND